MNRPQGKRIRIKTWQLATVATAVTVGAVAAIAPHGDPDANRPAPAGVVSQRSTGQAGTPSGHGTTDPGRATGKSGTPTTTTTTTGSSQPNGHPGATLPEGDSTGTDSSGTASAGTASATPSKAKVRPARPGGAAVYLTFDDGPNPAYTPQILDALADYHAKATFFVLGQAATAHPELVRRARAAGHRIGNHSWNHPQLTKLPNPVIRTQLLNTNKAIGGATCVRPPYGDHNPRVDAVISGVGAKTVMWSIDPIDWSRPGVDAIVSRIESQVQAGSIILMHDSGIDRSQSVAALRILLRDLSAAGYTFASVPGC